MSDDSRKAALPPITEHGIQTALVLHRCTTFRSRLQGLHGLTVADRSRMSDATLGQQGVYLQPCFAVHTIGVGMAIDVVFMDAAFNELKRVDSLQPNRLSMCRGAKSVVELPSGYCRRHRDYMDRILAALSDAR